MAVVVAVGAERAAAAVPPPAGVPAVSPAAVAAVPPAGMAAAVMPPLRPTSGPGTIQVGGGIPIPCLPALGCNPLAGAGADVASAMAGAVFQAFATFVADGVKAVLQQVSVAITKTTEVKLDRQWFQDHLGVMRSLAIVVLLPLMLVGLISAVIHRDAGQLARAGGVYVPIAIAGGAAAVGLTDMAIRLTDGVTSAVTGDMAGSVSRAMSALTDAVSALTTPLSPGAGAFLGLIVMLVLMAGALIVWIELLLRTSAIYVVVLFLPVALSGLVWKGTVAWTRRMVEVLVALILSKFVIVVVIDLAASMITAGDGPGTILQGATLLLLAACAPFALLRLVPLAEAGVIAHFERMERRPMAAASHASQTAVRTAMGAIDLAASGQALAQNGAAAPSKAMPDADGGQLNNIQPPPGWSPRPDAPDTSGAGPSVPVPVTVGAAAGPDHSLRDGDVGA
ncbi:MAG TPA: hypothetical protein VHT75_20190 [Acidimicrobiales bacterium]|nr:hypothetical protein [Acidimicrobiales bacterium]